MLKKTFQRRLHSRTGLLLLAILMMLSVFSAFPVSAGDVVLNNNQGSGNTVWFISGERSLVMNGFDLTPLGLNFPVSLDKVSINVVTAQPGAPVDVVVYQDANGGSPIDATLLRQTRIDIPSSGLFTYTFATPVEITQPVLWVGFYLPVDFEFAADTSGSSVLTYWAWRNGAEFDLTSLAAADVVGPADGSAPVNLDMNGIARITAELITDGTSTGTTTGTTATTGTAVSAASTGPGIRQVVGSSRVSLAPIVAYPGECTSVSYDSADVAVTYRNSVKWFCQVDNPAFSPATPEGYIRKGSLYDVYVFGVRSGASPLPYPVTHCIAPTAGDLASAVIGLGYGAPRQWEILPTVRFGSVICAEVTYAGYLSYFIPG